MLLALSSHPTMNILTGKRGLVQVKKLVVVDMAWHEAAPPAGSGGRAEGGPPPVPKWRTLWVYVVSCADGGDTDVEVRR